jgi:formylglycine-generating enzyme required for sulfatase activity
MPLVASGALGEGRRWVTPQFVPGRSPLIAMARVLAPIVGTNEEALAAWISTEPSAIARAFQALRQRRPDIGLVVFIDQTEELFTLASPSEANLVGQSLAALASIPAARVLAAIRGDFVTRLAALGGLGEGLSHSLYLLRPLTEENLRQVILGPAQTRGVAFETDAMLETLVASARTAPGGLPLLQFALAELWDARDLGRKLIPATALERMGGVEGGLARHADTVLTSLSPEQRVEARRILLRLVTAEGTRARRTRRELGAETGAAKEALDALVDGRLVVVRDGGNGGAACELAHEALIDGWGTLRDWLAGAAEDRRIRERLEAAAAEWQRLAHSRDALWHGRQLHEASRVDTEQLGQREWAFLASSRRAALWARVGRAALLASGPLLFALALVVSQIRGRHQVTARVDENLRAGTAALEEARRVHSQASERARAAFALYDGTAGKPPGSPPSPADVQWDEAEVEWAKARGLQSNADLGYVRATRLFESGLLLDGRRGDVKELRDEANYARLLLAEERHKDDLASELQEQLLASDSEGVWNKVLHAQGTLAISADPPTAEVTLEHYVDHGGRFQTVPVALFVTGRGSFGLPAGSYRLTLKAPGRMLVRYPFTLRRGEAASAEIRLPPSGEAPPGFIYVPAGTSLFGSGDEESLRLALDAPPLHPVHTAAFFIAQNEFTLGEWLRGIGRLPTNVGSRLTPGARSSSGSFSVQHSSRNGWNIIFNNGAREYRSGKNGLLIYRGRSRNAEQRWELLPVLAVSPANAVEFAAATGKGLRLCTEHEWERAARGADGRTYSTGNAPPGPNEANFDLTYGRISDAYGPDEVGRHPESDSPFDLHDVDGNVLEHVRSARRGGPIEKGGGWYFDVNFAGRLARHGALDVNTRTTFLGVRWCLDVNQ